MMMRIVSPFHPKAKQWVEGRADFFSILPIVADKEVYWFHCASLGEFDQALPVINLIKQRVPSKFILVSFFSPSSQIKKGGSVDVGCRVVGSRHGQGASKK